VKRSVLEAVTERDIDLLFLEEFHASESFRQWFRDRVLNPQAAEAKFINAWHSVTAPGLGESDLVLLFASTGGQRAAILLENKVDAPAQPDQAQRYRERGKLGVKRGDWDRFQTAIIAPSLYLARGGDAARFDAQLSYEEVREWFSKSEGEPSRSHYKSEVLAVAVERSVAGSNPVIDERVTRFYHDYWQCAAREFPELGLKDPGDRTRSSNWVGFRPKGFPKNRTINHKMDIGRVDLEIGGASVSVDELRAKYSHLLAADTTFGISPSHSSITGLLPRLRLPSSLPRRRAICPRTPIPMPQRAATPPDSRSRRTARRPSCLPFRSLGWRG